MAHTHEHDTDTYYLDQLCLVALSGAFAAVCLTLYFWRPDMLKIVLASQFHGFVLWSGIGLAILVVVRAIALWNTVGRAAPSKTHEHAHAHAHAHQAHDHAHGAGHDHAGCGHDHDHEHGEAHVHEHSHEHADDHDHGWAPWRYVILLLPIMLYLLGLPNKGPSVGLESATAIDVSQEAPTWAALVAAGPGSLLQPTLAVVASAGPAPSGQILPGDFKKLEGYAHDADKRADWEGKMVKVLGQFAPTSSNRHFTLVRWRIQCCGADAIPLKVPMVCREPLTGLPANEWVEVTGIVHFQQKSEDAYMTILQVPSRNNVQRTNPDPNPYIQ